MKVFWLIKIALLGALCLLCVTANAKPTNKYFPQETTFDTNIELPETYLGFEIGDWHIAPAALNGYMHKLAAQSPRVDVETIGYSHERNALLHVYISSPENITNLDEVLKQHQTAKAANDDILVLNLAYSVHGNEPSGANASALFAYYLAASNEDWVRDFLAKTIVIIEPAQNPDGVGRFSTHVNQNKGVSENFEPSNRDHFESWPSGRTNHYWFDLNRDWIFTVHPESKARIKAYQKWRPHVLGDYHEMDGEFPSYFFQPGHPKRTHPLTSKENQRITKGLANYHAKALDARAQPYFTEERYDDFYYGKGSAYPDATGAIGLLFEQTAVRGHARELGGVKIRFQEAIANHLATSISLLKGADAYRTDILNYRFSARDETVRRALADPVKAYIFSDDGDPERAQKLLDILNLHKIPVYGLTADIRIGQEIFKKDHAYAVKTNGEQYGLIRSLFETRTDFDDTVFYDVSTWNLPLALNLPYAPLKHLGNINTNPIVINTESKAKIWPQETPVAYAIPWDQYRAPHLLQALTVQELKPRLTLLKFTGSTFPSGRHKFKAGTILLQPKTAEEHERARQVFGRHTSVKVHELSSALSPSGPDLGSRNMKVLAPIKPALLVGEGVAPTEAGEIRYAVDKTFGVPLTLLDLDRVKTTDLNGFTHLLLADGDYKSRPKIPEILQSWVNAGGILIAQKKAAIWLENSVIFTSEKTVNESKKTNDENKKIKRRKYQDYEQDVGKRTISGAALRTKADLTHPLIFGFERAEIPVFYNAKDILSAAPISYDTPLVYAKKDLLITGYADKNRLDKIKDTPALTMHRSGKGKIVLFSHNNNFRSIWLGSERLYANALFFTQAIDNRKDEKSASNSKPNE